MKDLHNEIMNMRCDPGEREPTYALAYKLGHRDARHAAAALAARYEAVTEYEIERNRAAIAELVAALNAADMFITNGVELGFIRMPDADCPDPAHATPGIIRAAIAKHQTTTEKER